MDLPNRNVKNQMHHVLINGRWKHDITVKRGADVGSDLHLLLLYSNCQTTVEKKSHQGGRKEAKVQHCYAEKATCQQTIPYSCKKKIYETPSNIDEEAERDAESERRRANESYFIYACECVLEKKRKRDKSWIRDETNVERSTKRKGLQHHKD